MTFIRLGASLVLTCGAVAAQAALPFQHPALGGQAADGSAQARDAKPVIVGHPASPRWQVVHANGAHPAVLVAAHRSAIDPNTFLVQPPASTTWALRSAPETQLASVAR